MMFRYYLIQYFKAHQRRIKILYKIFEIYFCVSILVVVYGNLALMAYFKRDAEASVNFMDNLPLIVKILLIHSYWFYVVTAILAIISLFFTPAFARAKNHHIGKTLMEVKWQRWRFIGWMWILFLSGFLVFIGFGAVFKLYAFALTILLIVWWRILGYISANSLIITENGVLVKRIFSDVFIPYENLYPLSEKEIQEAIDDNMIKFGYGEWQSDNIWFELFVRNGNQVKESFMKFCNERIEEFRLSHKRCK